MSSLGPAHQGYNHQDLVTAYHLTSALARKYDAVTVDHKEIGLDDRFDDISVRSGARLTRKQIKSSQNAELTFELQDLTTTRRNLEIDSLVRCYRDAGEHAADEYRLCATWKEPTDAEFRTLLEPVAAVSTFDGYPTKTFRLRADLIWPDAAVPTWRRLRDATDITRQEFHDFAARFIIELNRNLQHWDTMLPSVFQQLYAEHTKKWILSSVAHRACRHCIDTRTSPES